MVVRLVRIRWIIFIPKNHPTENNLTSQSPLFFSSSFFYSSFFPWICETPSYRANQSARKAVETRKQKSRRKKPSKQANKQANSRFTKQSCHCFFPSPTTLPRSLVSLGDKDVE